MTKKKKIAKQKPISIGEFKTWIDGYCAASGPEWIPTQEQWDLIRGKIEAIIEQQAPEQKAQAVVRYVPQPQPYPVQHNEPYSEPYNEYATVLHTENSPVSFPKQQILAPQTVINTGNGINADTVGSPSPFG